MTPTPISNIVLEGREFLVKRDDLADKYLTGNKFRKLHSLLKTPKLTFSKIISYGGTQSNAMLSISAMCKQKGWEYLYYSKEISKTQEEKNTGNLYLAKMLGMKHIQIPHAKYKTTINELQFNLDEKTFLIDQGGAIIAAKEGLDALAEEIREQNPDVKALCTPSATGTTALFLALALPEYIVYTTPCVGDMEYLKKQMSALANIPNNLVILKPKKKYHFAKPYPNFLQIYKNTLESGIEFDLIYSPAMWECLFEQTDEKILYIHSGGVSGNESMMERYKKIM
ncbi:MAG: 1-aminocyclopropane-1-carboxylate deaminase [Sulfurimonas sp.]|nr:1-aminocyclopropane-1-carboxylate deaminase [Sulfurimonas sp.]